MIKDLADGKMITSNLSCMRIDGIVPLEFRSSSDHSNRSHPQSRRKSSWTFQCRASINVNIWLHFCSFKLSLNCDNVKMITSNLSCMRIDGIAPLEFRSSSDHSNHSPPQSRRKSSWTFQCRASINVNIWLHFCSFKLKLCKEFLIH